MRTGGASTIFITSNNQIMETTEQVLDDNYFENPSELEVQKLISLNKFIFLCIVSFGLYNIWWMFKAWVFFRDKEKSDITPLARAVFAIFFLGSLLTRIQEFAKEKSYAGSYSPAALFIGFFAVNFMSYLPEPYWLISLLEFIFLIPAFNAFNFARSNSSDLNTKEETSFSTRQIILIIFGTGVWVLSILGMVMG